MTYHSATVVNNCGSHTWIHARTREELWAKIEDGRARGLWNTVLGTETYEGIDWEAENEKAREYYRTGPKVPPEDVQLLREAETVAPEDYRRIDPSRGIWKETRDELERIRNRKRNELLWAANLEYIRSFRPAPE